MRKQIDILSVPIDVVTMEEAVERVIELTYTRGFHIVGTANAEMIMKAQENKELYNILKESPLVVADGAGTLWAAEQEGRSFPERVTGFDLACKLMERAANEEIPIYCLGGTPGIAEQALETVQRQVGPIPIVGIHSGFFDEAEEEAIIEKITKGKPSLIFVAMGVPKQEIWLSQKLSHLEQGVGIGIGGTFDILAGHVQRAPKWMQERRLEWLYRLVTQPSRAKRMLALPKFMWAVKRNKK